MMTKSACEPSCTQRPCVLYRVRRVYCRHCKLSFRKNFVRFLANRYIFLFYFYVCMEAIEWANKWNFFFFLAMACIAESGIETENCIFSNLIWWHCASGLNRIFKRWWILRILPLQANKRSSNTQQSAQTLHSEREKERKRKNVLRKM